MCKFDFRSSAQSCVGELLDISVTNCRLSVRPKGQVDRYVISCHAGRERRLTLRLKSERHSWCWAAPGSYDYTLCFILSAYGFVSVCMSRFQCPLVSTSYARTFIMFTYIRHRSVCYFYRTMTRHSIEFLQQKTCWKTLSQRTHHALTLPLPWHSSPPVLSPRYVRIYRSTVLPRDTQ
jgi:hypothetical protein